MIYLTQSLDAFIKASKSKRRIQKNGKQVSKQTIQNYLNLKKLIILYEEYGNEKVVIRPLSGKNSRTYNKEKNYWKKFQRNFSSYLFDQLDHYDNYVGAQFKLIRSLFKWLSIERGYNLGEFHSLFPIYKEEIQITVLSPDQLRFLIHDKAFEASLPFRLKKVKDIFVFGCTVALRSSDLMNLRRTNLISENGNTYILVQSKKTKTFTKTLLPKYAMEILDRNRSRSHFILPKISNGNLNRYVKELGALAGWNEIRIKTRTKRGIPCIVYKNKEKREHYRFYDHISTHTMRRTAITTMLRFGMDEWNVRRISGHAPGSKEFFRYVKLSQESIDKQSNLVHQKLQELV